MCILNFLITKQMLLKFVVVFVVLISLINPELKSQTGIEGQLLIDTAIWRPIAYLSLIPDLDNLNTMSYDMIVDKSVIDDSGRFSFKTQYLPANENLFRIHVARKIDPMVSLIIGGRDENYIFVIANNHSQVFIKDSCNLEFIRDALISGYYPNKMIHRIDVLANYLDTTTFNGTPVKNELIKSAVCAKLRFIADTCSNPLVSLYALYKSKFEKNYPINQQFYRNFLSKWKHDKSSYFVTFRKKIPVTKSIGIGFSILLIAIAFMTGFCICFFLIKLFRENKNLLQDLSVQERKIFGLILEGKSNKEISDILNIGLSTVKSHVNSIYSKLGINSRKDVFNLNLDGKNNGTLKQL